MRYNVLSLIMAGLIGIVLPLQAQTKFSVNGQYMNRAEYRHGFSTLAAPDQDAAFFISQRARVITNLQLDMAEINVSIQDIRTWGTTSNITLDNAGLLSVHEAWVALHLSKKVDLKMGRQEIAYDEDRIFGSLDWAMQARRHDAALLKFYDSASNTTLHFGFAYNQDSEKLSETIYLLPNNYKTFQYMYFNRAFGKIKTSFLFLNNGYQYTKPGTIPTEYTTVFSQTFGPRFVYKETNNKLSGNLAFYYQTGTNNQDKSLSAYDLLAEAAYQITPSFSLTGGLELLSGTSQINADPTKSKSFNPLFGTNHRFNGFMDYFYVGNHINSVGLQDIYVKGLLKRKKIFYGANVHFFSALADIEDLETVGPNAANKNLGTEIDFVANYSIANAISIQAGYSQLLAGKSLEFVKSVTDGSKQTNNWAYLMVIVRPGTAWPRVGLKL